MDPTDDTDDEDLDDLESEAEQVSWAEPDPRAFGLKQAWRATTRSRMMAE